MRIFGECFGCKCFFLTSFLCRDRWTPTSKHIKRLLLHERTDANASENDSCKDNQEVTSDISGAVASTRQHRIYTFIEEKVRTNFCLLPCDMSQRTSRYYSEKFFRCHHHELLLFSEPPKRGRKNGAARKLSKSVEKLFDAFWRFLTFFCPARELSKTVEKLFDTFWRFLTWPVSTGPFCNPLIFGGGFSWWFFWGSKFLLPHPTPGILTKDFCLQPGLGWNFLQRRTWSAQKFSNCNFQDSLSLGGISSATAAT